MLRIREDVLPLPGIEPTVSRSTSPYIGMNRESVNMIHTLLYCVDGDVIIPLSTVYFTVFVHLEVFCLHVGTIFHASVYERGHFSQSVKP